jgi:hypothetical protein
MSCCVSLSGCHSLIALPPLCQCVCRKLSFPLWSARYQHWAVFMLEPWPPASHSEPCQYQPDEPAHFGPAMSSNVCCLDMKFASCPLSLHTTLTCRARVWSRHPPRFFRRSARGCTHSARTAVVCSHGPAAELLQGWLVVSAKPNHACFYLQLCSFERHGGRHVPCRPHVCIMSMVETSAGPRQA